MPANFTVTNRGSEHLLLSDLIAQIETAAKNLKRLNQREFELAATPASDPTPFSYSPLGSRVARDVIENLSNALNPYLALHP